MDIPSEIEKERSILKVESMFAGALFCKAVLWRYGYKQFSLKISIKKTTSEPSILDFHLTGIPIQ